MAVAHGDPVALRAEGQLGGTDGAAFEPAEDLGGLGAELGLLPGDLGKHVVESLQRGHARMAGAGEGLQRRDQNPPKAEGPAKRLQGEAESDGGAVGVGGDCAPESSALGGEEGQVVGVHLGNHEGHLRVHAQGARVADHREAGGPEGGFRL